MAAAKPEVAEKKPEPVQHDSPERKVQPLGAVRIEPAEYRRTVYIATAHENTIPEDLLDPAYWAQVSATLKPWDRIDVRANDGTWYAEYLVLDAGRTYAKVQMLSSHALTTGDVAMSQLTAMSPYEVVYRGPHDMWSVIRKSDRAVVHEKAATQGAAVDWMTNRLKAKL